MRSNFIVTWTGPTPSESRALRRSWAPPSPLPYSLSESILAHSARTCKFHTRTLCHEQNSLAILLAKGRLGGIKRLMPTYSEAGYTRLDQEREERSRRSQRRGRVRGWIHLSRSRTVRELRRRSQRRGRVLLLFVFPRFRSPSYIMLLQSFSGASLLWQLPRCLMLRSRLESVSPSCPRSHRLVSRSRCREFPPILPFSIISWCRSMLE